MADAIAKLRRDLAKRGLSVSFDTSTPAQPKRAARRVKTPPSVVTAVRAALQRYQGISATTIAWALVPELAEYCDGALRGTPGYPSDPDDYSRCRRIVALIPSGIEKMAEVAAAFPQVKAWAGLAKAWPELEELWLEEEKRADRHMPKLYARIQEACRG